MSVESQIVSRLAAVSGVTALIASRVYPVIIPQNATLPAVCYQRVSTNRPSCFGNDAGIVQARFQIDCLSESEPGAATGARAVAAAVISALQRWSTNSGSPTVHDIFIDNQSEDYEPETKIHRVIIDIIVWYSE